MNCPHCNSPNTTVVETRPSNSNTRSRRRKCQDCNNWFPTLELIIPEKGYGAYYDTRDSHHWKIRGPVIRRISTFIANSLAA